jgi:hypothetical protein
MDFRVMDEAAVFAGRGLALLVNEGERCAFSDGCRIRDALGACTWWSARPSRRA